MHTWQDKDARRRLAMVIPKCTSLNDPRWHERVRRLAALLENGSSLKLREIFQLAARRPLRWSSFFVRQVLCAGEGEFFFHDRARDTWLVVIPRVAPTPKIHPPRSHEFERGAEASS